MKLVINAGPVSPAILTVVNGDDIIREERAWGPQKTFEAIDGLFKEYYIEAVQLIADNVYTLRYVDWIIEHYKNVEVIY